MLQQPGESQHKPHPRCGITHAQQAAFGPGAACYETGGFSAPDTQIF